MGDDDDRVASIAAPWTGATDRLAVWAHLVSEHGAIVRPDFAQTSLDFIHKELHFSACDHPVTWLSATVARIERAFKR